MRVMILWWHIYCCFDRFSFQINNRVGNYSSQNWILQEMSTSRGKRCALCCSTLI